MTNTLPSQIATVADDIAQFQVQRHCSRVVVTCANLSRTFVAEPGIAKVVQFRPDEFALIGLEVGCTTLTMWFENLPEPVICHVAIVPPPVEIKSGGDCPSFGVEEAAGVVVDPFHAGVVPGSVPICESQVVEHPRGAQFAVRPVKALTRTRAAALGLPRPRYNGHTPFLEADRAAPR